MSKLMRSLSRTSPMGPRFAVACGLLLWASWVLSSIALADPGPGTVYNGSAYAKAIALDVEHDCLYLASSTASPDSNLYVIQLGENGNPVSTDAYCTTTAAVGLALDAWRRRLYVATSSGNQIVVFPLDDQGRPIGLGQSYPRFTAGASALALDPGRGRLYVALKTNSLGVMQLDAAGDPGGTTTTSEFATVEAPQTLALDPRRDRLYVGCSNHTLAAYILDAEGIAAAGNTLTVGAAALNTLALDSMRRCLYAGVTGDSIPYTVRLAANGDLVGLDTSYFPYSVGERIISLCLDATANRMYVGTNSMTLTTNLRWFDLAGGLPTGAVHSADVGYTVNSIAVDAQRQRLYTGSDPSRYFVLSEPAQVPLWIGDGSGTTNNVNVELKWCVPNARFVLVENSGLANFTFPTAPSTNFGSWISTDDATWTNDSVTRAVTRTVNAVLAPGSGDKDIYVWFGESSGASNTLAVARRAHFRITLADGSPTFTPTATPFENTRTSTPTMPPTLTRTPTGTFTWTPTASQTSTPTRTASPTLTTTWTSTATPTGTPTHTHTPTASPTGTPTPTPTSTPTSTASPTLTWTPTATPTGTPTLSPTLTATLSSTPTPSLTLTSTLTPTPTPSLTPSHTPSPSTTKSPTLTPTVSETVTVSPTRTETPFHSRTPTPTVTLTATRTPSYTASPTVTLTGTVTPTLPPTSTPTPAVVLVLDRNRFCPGAETLGIKVGFVQPADGEVVIFTLTGRKVRAWPASAAVPGYLTLTWDGRNDTGETVASGIYYVLFWSDGKRQVVRKVLVVR